MSTFKEVYDLLRSNVEEMERRAREIKSIASLINTVKRAPSRRDQDRLDRLYTRATKLLGDVGPQIDPLCDAIVDLGKRSGYAQIITEGEQD